MEWIDVEVKKPETLKAVLICCEGSWFAEHCTAYLDLYGEWYWVFSEPLEDGTTRMRTCDEKVMAKVTHWMDRPMSPRCRKEYKPK